MEYDTLTDQINNAVSSSISSGTDWNAVPGGLDKVSASAMGFAWGIGGGHVWICQLPCLGNWKQVNIPVTSTIRDITTDDMHVYVLYQDKLAINTADNTGIWVIPDKVMPPGISKIISTASYIWGQSEDKKFRLAKPGTTGDWQYIDDKMNIKITSASSGHLYGVSAKGEAMVTDESMQTSWSTIPEFGGKYNSILGDADQTAIFGIDAENSLKRCLNGKCTTVDTKGYTPQNITIEPTSKQMWMTTTTSSKSGNIFSQPLVTDYTDILKTVGPMDKKRDEVVAEAETQYDQGTYSGIMSKQFTIIKNMISKIFELKPASAHETDQTVIQGDINETKDEMNTLKFLLPFIQNFLLVLALTVLVYTASDFLGEATHLVALAVLLSGIAFFAINK